MDNKRLELVFKTKSFRRIPNPYFLDSNGGAKAPEMYIMMVDVKDVPENIPMETNPREQKLTTNVAKKIRESLKNPVDKNFYLLNRGLLLSAGSVTYDNKKDLVHVLFEDFNVHGDVDGGHTYRIIKEVRDELDYGEQYVKIEVLVGIEDMFQELASARNISVPVQDKSMAELYNKFDIIKAALVNEPYKDEIIFRENEDGRIDVSDIVAVLNMFNLSRYSGGPKDNAIVSYNAKKACIDDYLKCYDKYGDSMENPYVQMNHIISDIFKLYDHLERKVGSYYSQAVKNGKYGKTIGVASKYQNGKVKKESFKTRFFNADMEYATPTGFLYPIIGAFRALVEVGDDGYYKWKKDPVMILDAVGPELVTSVVDMSRELGNNPTATGKNKTIWQNLYMTVMMESL